MICFVGVLKEGVFVFLTTFKVVVCTKASVDTSK